MFENFKCLRCGGNNIDIIDYPLDIVDGNDYTIVCKDCGTSYYISVPVPNESNGMLDHPAGFDAKCPVCESYLILSGNNTLSELYGDDDIPLEDDAITMNCTCPNCGTFMDVIPVKPSEEKNYNFFQ